MIIVGPSISDLLIELKTAKYLTRAGAQSSTEEIDQTVKMEHCLKDRKSVEYESNANLVNIAKIPSIPETVYKCPNHDFPMSGASQPILVDQLNPFLLVPQCDQANLMEVDTNASGDIDIEKAVVDVKDPGEPKVATSQKQGEVGKQGSPKRLREDKDEKNNNKRQRKMPEQTSLSIGISQSATASRSLNEKIHNGTFLLNPTRWKNFQRKIRLCDRNATFNENEPRSVRHSKCGKLLQMKDPYNIGNFEKHVANCKKTTTVGMPTLASMFSNQLRTQVPKVKDTAKFSIPTPCPGLSASNHPRIPIYLKRSPAPGGGAMRIDRLASSMYPDTPYSQLSDGKRLDVRAAQKTQNRWRNEPNLAKIYSTACKRIAHISDLDSSPAPCYECQVLLIDTSFRKALARDLPDPANVKYTPKVYINDDAIEKWGNIHQLEPLIREFEKVCIVQ